MFVDLCRVYDDHRRGINLLTFLRKVKRTAEKPPEWLPLNEIDPSQLASDISICEARRGKCDPSSIQLIALIDRLRKWRNKIVAHYEDQIAIFDSERFTLSHPWELEDFEALVAQGVVILDRYAFSEGRDIRYTEALAGLANHETGGEVVFRLAARADASGNVRDLRDNLT